MIPLKSFRTSRAPTSRALLLGCAVTIAACGDTTDAPPVGDDGLPELPRVDALLASLDGLPLDALIDAAFRAQLSRQPQAVIELGLQDQFQIDDAALTPSSGAYDLEELELSRGILQRLQAATASGAPDAARLARDAYIWTLEDHLRSEPFLDHDYPVTHFITGVHIDLEIFFDDLHPVRTEREARAYVARLRRVDDKLAQLIEGLDRRADAGIVPPAMLIEWALAGIDRTARGAARNTSYYLGLSQGLDGLSAAGGISSTLRTELLIEAEEVIRAWILPAYSALSRKMNELKGRAPAAIGVGTLPNGDAYYRYALRRHTTTELSPDEIHALGLVRLDEIHAEMQVHFDALGYPKSRDLLAQFDRVSRDGGSVSAADAVDTYTSLIRDAEARLPEAFDVFPAAPWTVIGVQGGGFYIPASLDGERPGAFYADGSGQPRYGMRTLAYHEVIPGHHLQIAIAQEQDASLFRRVKTFTAHTEGWALYAEQLAGELGWYDDDPYGDLGRLQAAAFRASRLVLDTGIHAKGWTFSQATAFMRDATGYRPEVINVDGQIARYAAWPGQATAYELGRAEIERLRTSAQGQLGANFDTKAFHGVMLRAGVLPLPVLSEVVARYVANRL